jgi:hypothetical protein
MKLSQTTVVLILLLVLRAFFALPLDSSLPGGTDTTSHLLRSFHVMDGAQSWSYDWSGGFWFYGYPPLFYFLVAAFGGTLGLVLSYKFLADLLFVLLPLAFYLLLKEFKLPEKYALLSVAIFSFMPFSSYYLYDGRIPSLLALFICLFFWKFQLRYVRNGSASDFLLAVALLAASILAHHLTAAILFFVAFAWAFVEKGRPVIRPFAVVTVAALALSAFWIAPFLVETSGNPAGTGLIATPASVGIISSIVSSSYASDFFSSPFSPLFLIALEAFTALVLVFAVILSAKNKRLKNVVIVAVLLGVLSLIMSFKRALIVAPIPLSVLVALTVSEAGKLKKVLAVAALLFFFLGFIALNPLSLRSPELPAAEDRVIYLPVGSSVGGAPYDMVLPALAGNEDIIGWYPQAESAAKLRYDLLLIDVLGSSPEEYFSLLRAGDVNTVIINATQSELVERFSSSGLYDQKEQYGFVVFMPKEKFSYIEVGGNYTPADVSKLSDRITAVFSCLPGSVSVKESFDYRWHATLNGKDVPLVPDEYGFSTFESDVSGECVLDMRFSDPPYAVLFRAVSLVSLALLAVFSARHIMTMPRPERVRK